ncbi:MAG: hypothetical protein WAS27_02940 [Candidatus Saccharimonadales bacterium]
MNPELPAPQITPELTPSREQGGEYGQTLQSPEQVGERTPEKEQFMQNVDRQVAPAPPVVPAAPLPVIPAPSTKAVVQDDDLPTIANDDDLIEKEWVDKAKKIIADTKDDPYRREREVSLLQADYLRKRYGKEIGVAE